MDQFESYREKVCPISFQVWEGVSPIYTLSMGSFPDGHKYVKYSIWHVELVSLSLCLHCIDMESCARKALDGGLQIKVLLL